MLEQIQALQNESVQIQLSNYCIIEVTGEDAGTFLQSQFSCDVLKLEKSKLGAFCNTKGRVQFLVRFFKKENTFYLMLPKELSEQLISELKKFVFISDVQIKPTDFTITMTSNHPVGFEMQELPNCYCSFLEKKPLEIKKISEEVWKIKSIEHKIPEIFLSTYEKFLPHNINLDTLKVLDFKKGCYRGQEIVSRMHYRGKPKYSLAVKAHPFADDSLIGKSVYAGEKKVGTVVTWAPSAEGYSLLLELHKEYSDITEFTIQ